MEAINVVKIGGNVINNADLLKEFLKQFALLDDKKILIHGGGSIATDLALQLGIQQQMIDGRRVTDADTLKVVTMVYAGLINKQIVALLQSYGVDAIGISGADGDIIQAHKRNGTVDFGYVGDIDAVDETKLQALLQLFDTVVIAPITMDTNGQLLNTNADTIAQEAAKALAKHLPTRLIYTFEKEGVLLDTNDEASVIKELNEAIYKEMKAQQRIHAGMIPKLDNAFEALAAGVYSVYIGKANALERLVSGDSGTKIMAS